MRAFVHINDLFRTKVMAPSSSLVAAYSSDSEDDERDVTKESEAEAKPNEKPVSFTSPGLALGLPPPKRQSNTSQAKRHIVIEASSTTGYAPDVRVSAHAKKARHDVKPSSDQHSLLSMLPAPQGTGAKPSTKLKHEDNVSKNDTVLDEDMRLVVHGAHEDADENNAHPKKKGNEDFRAMLGLAPKVRPTAHGKTPLVLSETDKRSRASIERAHEPELNTDSKRVERPDMMKDSAAFSTAPDVGEPEANDHVTGFQDADTSQEPVPEHFSGWRRDPDGSWFPVTPEAHAVYAAWAQQQAQQSTQALPHHYMSQGSQAATFDVSAELEHVPRILPNDTASPAHRSTRENLVSEKLRTDKFTNMRARTRGQLTSLLAMAHENRPMLEERWAQGKSKMRDNKKRYGF